LQDKIKDAFANASNTSILAAVSNIFRVAMHDPRQTLSLRSSASTLGTVDELNGNARGQLSALEDVNMQGLANNFGFIQDHRTVSMIQWTAQLVAKIIQ
jgi:hypothetical protein